MVPAADDGAGNPERVPEPEGSGALCRAPSPPAHRGSGDRTAALSLIQSFVTSSSRWSSPPSVPPSATGRSPRSHVAQRNSIGWCVTARRCGVRSNPPLAAAQPLWPRSRSIHPPWARHHLDPAGKRSTGAHQGSLDRHQLDRGADGHRPP